MNPLGKTITDWNSMVLFSKNMISTKNIENIQENEYLSENNIKSIRDIDFP